MQGWDPVAGEREMKFTGTGARPRTAAQSSAHASHTRAARKRRLEAVSSEEEEEEEEWEEEEWQP
eukprot:2456364-Pleurochrysis_carterae.AAC.1